MVGAQTALSLNFYIAIILITLGILWMIYVFKKKNLGRRDLFKLIIFSFAYTLFVEIFYFVVGMFFQLFVVMCKVGTNCPSRFEMFLSDSQFIVPIIFFGTGLIYISYRYFKD